MSDTVLITGASSGIGKVTARYFHAKGWNVVATMRTPAKETELTGLDRVLVTRLDVTDEPSIGAALKEAIATFGSIDAVVNNAGYGAFGTLEAFSIERIRRQFETNVVGLLAVTKAVLPHLRRQKSGTIVNISSVGGKVTFPLGTLYHGTKFAVEGISDGLRYELEAVGVKVKVVEPGGIRTDFAGRSLDFSNDESLAEYQPMVGQLMSVMSAMGEQASEPELVAEAIWNAVTDGTDTVRYVVGEDARQFLASRQALDDGAFFAAMKQQMGL